MDFGKRVGRKLNSEVKEARTVYYGILSSAMINAAGCEQKDAA
jgi:hypothetical protein